MSPLGLTMRMRRRFGIARLCITLAILVVMVVVFHLYIALSMKVPFVWWFFGGVETVGLTVVVINHLVGQRTIDQICWFVGNGTMKGWYRERKYADPDVSNLCTWVALASISWGIYLFVVEWQVFKA